MKAIRSFCERNIPCGSFGQVINNDLPKRTIILSNLLHLKNNYQTQDQNKNCHIGIIILEETVVDILSNDADTKTPIVQNPIYQSLATYVWKNKAGNTKTANHFLSYLGFTKHKHTILTCHNKKSLSLVSPDVRKIISG